jgi:hypothetical protein
MIQCHATDKGSHWCCRGILQYSQMLKYAVWFSFCVWMVLHQQKSITNWCRCMEHLEYHWRSCVCVCVCVVPCFQQWHDMLMIRSDADDRLCLLHYTLCHTYAIVTEGGCIQITDITWEIGKQLECSQHCPEPSGLQKSAFMLCTKEHGWSLSLSYGTQMHLTHSAHEGEQLLRNNLQGTKCVNHVTPETKKALVMMTLEVTWKCHFQMLTLTVNYTLNQEFKNCQVFFAPLYNFLLENIHEDGKKKHLRVHFHHSDRYCTLFGNRFYGSKNVFMLLCFTTHFVNINTDLKLHYGNFVISTHTVKTDEYILAFIFFEWSS